MTAAQTARPGQAYPGLMTYEEAAAALGIKVGAVKAAITAKKMHPVKLLGVSRKFLHREEVESYSARRYGRQVVEDQAARMAQAAASNIPSPNAPTPEELASIQARTNAASGPLLQGWRETLEGWQETRKGLTAVAVASILAAQGISVDPKRLAG